MPHSDKVITTPKGRKWWGGKVDNGKYAYWLKYGDDEDEMFHIDAKEAFDADEIDDLIDLLLWMQDNSKKIKYKKLK